MSDNPITSKEAWLEYALKVRNHVWEMYQEEACEFLHVELWLKENPHKPPGAEKYDPASCYMFIGHFTEGEGLPPLAESKAAFAMLVRTASTAGLGIASLVYNDFWQINLKPGEKPPDDLSKDPRATLALLFRAEHQDYGINWWTATVKDTDGKRSLEMWKEHSHPIHGQLLSYIAPRTPPITIRMVAHILLKDLDKRKEADEAPDEGVDKP